MLLSFRQNPIAFVTLRLGRFWCETGAVAPARADESAIDIYGPLSPNSFQDDHRADRLGPLKAETGVRFP